jgi:hypothetical protein
LAFAVDNYKRRNMNILHTIERVRRLRAMDFGSEGVEIMNETLCLEKQDLDWVIGEIISKF